jgi:hypothetical protein
MATPPWTLALWLIATVLVATGPLDGGTLLPSHPKSGLLDSPDLEVTRDAQGPEQRLGGDCQARVKRLAKQV